MSDNARAAQDFTLQLDKVAEKFSLPFAKVMRIIGLDALERIVRRTPVGDPDYWQGHPKGTPPGNAKPPPGYIGGNARNNWWTSLNEPLTNPQGRPADKSEQNASTVEGAASISQAQLGDTIFIQNGVPYILKLEDGTQSPRQAPNGMVAVTFEELEQHFSQMLEQELLQ